MTWSRCAPISPPRASPSRRAPAAPAPATWSSPSTTPTAPRSSSPSRSPASVEAQGAGKFLSPTRVSDRIYHAGFLVGNTQRALDFYGNILGFQEFWRGSGSPTQLSWINMRVPDGTDYVELMLYRTLPRNLRHQQPRRTPCAGSGRCHRIPADPPRHQEHRPAAGHRARRPQRQAPAQPLRSRRHPRRADGAEHRRRQARPIFHRASAPSRPRLVS